MLNNFEVICADSSSSTRLGVKTINNSSLKTQPTSLRELQYIFRNYGRSKASCGGGGGGMPGCTSSAGQADSTRTICSRFHARRESEIDERTIKLLKVSCCCHSCLVIYILDYYRAADENHNRVIPAANAL